MTGKLSDREAAFLSALKDKPQSILLWGQKTLSKFKGYRADTEQKLWLREFIHITDTWSNRTFRITPSGREALAIHERQE